jgi:CubicO group peptidase (beta-lactamase class C family)
VTAAAVGMDDARLAGIDALLQSYVDELGFVGVSVVVARRGETVFVGHHGQRDREADLPMTADTIFRLYSTTKPIVATALMTLVDDGRLALTDPVATWIPAFATLRVLGGDGRLVEQVRPVRVVDLLTHTSGLTNELQATPVAALYQQAAIHADASRPLTQFVDALTELPLAYQPGERWHYGASIDVAAALIEVIADRPLGQFLDERLFGPLGMTDTGFAVPDAERGRLAAMYGRPDVLGRGQTALGIYDAWVRGEDERRDVSATYPADAPGVFARGGFGLFSTSGDLLRFAQMLLDDGELDGKRVLAPETVQLMHRNHLDAALLPWESGGQPVLGYGFGLGSSVLADPEAAGRASSPGTHGWPGAACTEYWVDPGQEVIGILMAQSMMRMDQPVVALEALVYDAIVD